MYGSLYLLEVYCKILREVALESFWNCNSQLISFHGPNACRIHVESMIILRVGRWINIIQFLTIFRIFKLYLLNHIKIIHQPIHIDEETQIFMWKPIWEKTMEQLLLYVWMHALTYYYINLLLPTRRRHPSP